MIRYIIKRYMNTIEKIRKRYTYIEFVRVGTVLVCLGYLASLLLIIIFTLYYVSAYNISTNLFGCEKDIAIARTFFFKLLGVLVAWTALAVFTRGAMIFEGNIPVSQYPMVLRRATYVTRVFYAPFVVLFLVVLTFFIVTKLGCLDGSRVHNMCDTFFFWKSLTTEEKTDYITSYWESIIKDIPIKSTDETMQRMHALHLYCYRSEESYNQLVDAVNASSKCLDLIPEELNVAKSLPSNQDIKTYLDSLLESKCANYNISVCDTLVTYTNKWCYKLGVFNGGCYAVFIVTVSTGFLPSPVLSFFGLASILLSFIP